MVDLAALIVAVASICVSGEVASEIKAEIGVIRVVGLFIIKFYAVSSAFEVFVVHRVYYVENKLLEHLIHFWFIIRGYLEDFHFVFLREFLYFLKKI